MTAQTEYFFDKELLKRLSWRRLAYLIIAVGALISCEYMTGVYRPYIYRHNVFDFGLADTAGNLFGTVALIYFMLFLSHADWSRALFWTGSQTLGVIVYEIVQPIFPWGTFDWKDIAATCVGGGIAFLILLPLHGKSIRLTKKAV